MKEERQNKPLTYISLFSCAGVGCYGFKQEGYECVATVELLPRRLQIQKYNNKCRYESGYICGDMTKEATKNKIFDEIQLWKDEHNIDSIDVLISTPPCQGMSLLNLQRNDEKERNSLVVESIKMVKDIKPKYFVFENVRSFLCTICTDTDGVDRQIRDAIIRNLSDDYDIDGKIINFKDYGSPSSRTRTLVIGKLKTDVSWFGSLSMLFPSEEAEKTLRETIGNLKPLKTMGEIDPNDIYHSFRRYPEYMKEWIKDVPEGGTAFDNEDPDRIPHMVKNGQIIPSKSKVNDRYRRQIWDKVAYCVHTRNDILSSQSTIHPTDNRVFSVRELMRMMSIPDDFRWTNIDFDDLNKLSLEDKEKFIKKNDTNIRQVIGEAVPTVIFRKIAHNIIRLSAIIPPQGMTVGGGLA